jgi:hypothetical protein
LRPLWRAAAAPTRTSPPEGGRHRPPQDPRRTCSPIVRQIPPERAPPRLQSNSPCLRTPPRELRRLGRGRPRSEAGWRRAVVHCCREEGAVAIRASPASNAVQPGQIDSAGGGACESAWRQEVARRWSGAGPQEAGARGARGGWQRSIGMKIERESPRMRHGRTPTAKCSTCCGDRWSVYCAV